MKVYVVLCCNDFEPFEIQAVASTEEKAEFLGKQIAQECGFKHVRIEAWDLDQTPI